MRVVEPDKGMELAKAAIAAALQDVEEKYGVTGIAALYVHDHKAGGATSVMTASPSLNHAPTVDSSSLTEAQCDEFGQAHCARIAQSAYAVYWLARDRVVAYVHCMKAVMTGLTELAALINQEGGDSGP